MDYNTIRTHTLNYFKGNDLLTDVFINKYALFDSKTNDYKESSPEDMFNRIASELSRIEQKYPNPISKDLIYSLLKDFKYIIPGGSNLYGIGNDYSYSVLGNCFVLETGEDSYGGIFKIDQEQVQLMKRRGGVGHDISYIRPNGAVVSNSAKYSTGVVSFMGRFSNSTREVAQDGRRGALMLTISIKHVDSQTFIESKKDLTKITGANISVRIDDIFMNAVKNDEDYYQTFPIEKSIEEIQDVTIEHEYNVLYKGIIDGTYYKKVKAKKVWETLINQAHASAEPGLLFWDKILKESPADIYSEEGFKTLCVNPCGEIPLNKDSCRLLSLNLYSFVDDPFTEKAKFNWDKFKEYSRIAQRFMDDIVDLEEEKINKVLNKVKSENTDVNLVEINLWNDLLKNLKKGRRTGLSGIGIADTLAALNIDYNSEKGIAMSNDIYKQLAIHSYTSSIIMANERGAFPICDIDKEMNHVFIDRIFNELPKEYQNLYLQYGRRNIANLCVPPSGSLSMLSQISSGIEPVYQIYYTRRRKVNPNDVSIKVDFVDQLGDSWQEYKVFHPNFLTWYWYNIADFDWDRKELIDLTNDELNDLISISPYHNNTAYDLNPLFRVKMQSVIGQWVDHSLSSTLNLKKETTEEEVSDIYLNAWEMGLKGLTIYRDGSRSGVLISNDDTIKSIDKFIPKKSAKRPKELKCNIHRLTALKEKWIVLIGILNDNPYEIFALKEPDEFTLPKHIKEGILTKVKRGVYKLSSVNGKENIHLDNIMDYIPEDDKADTRKYSLMLRHHIHPKYIVQTVDKFSKDITSFDKAISRVLKLYIDDDEEVSGEKCPACGNTLIYVDGCVSCTCGFERC